MKKIILLTITLMCIPFIFSESFKESILMKNEEPQVSESESKVLQEVIAIYEDNIKNAIVFLKSKVNRSSSAALDFTLGSLYFQDGSVNKATEFFKKAVEKTPNFMRARGNLARVYLEQNNIDEAIKEFKTVLLYGTPQPNLLTMLGYSFLMKNELIAAEAAYKQAILYESKDLNSHLGLAKCLLYQDRHKEALTVLKEIMKKDHTKKEVWFLMANCFISLEEYDQAIQTLECTKYLSLSTPESHSTLGDLYLNQYMFEAALKNYKLSFCLEMKNIPMMLKAIHGFLMLNKLDEAAELIQKMHQLKKSINEGQKLKLNLFEAKIAFRQNKDDLAEMKYLEILKTKPLNFEALFSLGDLYNRQNLLNKAMIMYQRAGSIPEKKVQSLNSQAKIEIKRENFKKAYELLQQSYELEPKEYIKEYLENLKQLVELSANQ